MWPWIRKLPPALQKIVSKIETFIEKRFYPEIYRKRMEGWVNPAELPSLLQDELQLSNAELVKNWYLRKLQIIMKQEGFLVKRLKPGKILLYNFWRDSNYAHQTRDDFMLLKNKYISESKYNKALQMLRLAAVFGKLPQEEKDWAYRQSNQNQVKRGYWLGEAAIELTGKHPGAASRELVEVASKNGNEFATFILDCTAG